MLTQFTTADRYYEEDKLHFLSLMTKLSDTIRDKHDEDWLIQTLTTLYHDETSPSLSFSSLLHPIQLYEALIHGDFLWQEISHEEFVEMYSKLRDFTLFQWQVLTRKQQLERDYQIEIILLDHEYQHHDIVGQPLHEVEMIASIVYLDRLIRRYPTTFITNTRLQKIFIASSFQSSDPHSFKHLGGFKSNEDFAIHISFVHLKKSFDHELYHQAMQRYDDTDQRAALRKEWDQLYNAHHADKQSHGFARDYGRENIAEDQATVAEELMKNYHHLMRRTIHDHVLAQKVTLVKTAYKKLSDGRIDDEFFENL